ncbi:MAG: FumA C-terminus/TtdB family hydratase beta subunit [Lentisphaeria bacterium]|nr:FumA C-terminus/TtdB family hydratase beta subunit [Lentisphaeria bacterium]
MTVSLTTPISETDIRSLTAGDYVTITGTIFTARDAAHSMLAGGGEAPCDLRGAVIYHCGPVMLNVDGEWRVMAAGPTTSIREEPYMAALIERFSLRGIIGKGGMGEDTLAACRQFGCVYLHAVGGAAQVLAQSIKDVPAVFLKEEFGSPEAIWEMRVVDFPALVTIDAHGESLHKRVESEARKRLNRLLV